MVSSCHRVRGNIDEIGVLQADTLSTNQGPVFVSLSKAACRLIEVSWNLDRAALESFLLSLAAYVRERLEQVMDFLYSFCM